MNYSIEIRDRFERKILRIPFVTCWLWIGSSGEDEYGSFWNGYRVISAHRMAWELYRDSIPEGQVVRHSCDFKLCVNPDHLLLGTRYDNIDDAISREKYFNSKKQECKWGHPFNELNTRYAIGRGGRIRRHCITCMKGENRLLRKFRRILNVS